MNTAHDHALQGGLSQFGSDVLSYLQLEDENTMITTKVVSTLKADLIVGQSILEQRQNISPGENILEQRLMTSSQ